MGVSKERALKCPCWNNNNKETFQKLIELEDTGLVIYHGIIPTNNVIRDADSGNATDNDTDIDYTSSTKGYVFILHNTKNDKITPGNLRGEIDINAINCPRCRQKLEHARELMETIPVIEEGGIIGVCDHCYFKASSFMPIRKSCACKREVKIFLSAHGKQKTLQRIIYRSFSEVDINLYDQKVKKTTREPNIQMMFNNSKSLSDTEVIEKKRKIQKKIEKEKEMAKQKISKISLNIQQDTYKEEIPEKITEKETNKNIDDDVKIKDSRNEFIAKKRKGKDRHIKEQDNNIYVSKSVSVSNKKYIKKPKDSLLNKTQDSPKEKKDYSKNNRLTEQKQLPHVLVEKSETKQKTNKGTELKKKTKTLPIPSEKPKENKEKSVKKEAPRLPRAVSEINVELNKIKAHEPSEEDLIHTLVKNYQSTIFPRERTETLQENKEFVKKVYETKRKPTLKPKRIKKNIDEEMEDDEETIINKETVCRDIIVGENVCKYKLPFLPIEKEIEEVKPMMFHLDFKNGLPIVSSKDHKRFRIQPDKETKIFDQAATKGIIRYALSDRTFIEKGWTTLPMEKVVRKMNVYRMHPARPEFDWFEHNKNKGPITYDTGERLAEIDEDGHGRWYYRNGRLALDYHDAKEANAQQRFLVYSSGERDGRGRLHPITLLATFDHLGNGVVFDHAGKIRLKYNQTEGVVLDRSIGPVSQWKWHSLNDPPVLQQVMIDNQMAHKDPAIFKMDDQSNKKSDARSDNEDMLAIEFDNFIKEKSKKLTQQFKPFQIKMKSLKINDNFSLKVLDQASIYLIFRDGSTNLKLNMGMTLNHQEIVDTDIAEVGEVSNSIERLPAKTDSIAQLQHRIADAQRHERMRTEREKRLRPPKICESADKLTGAASRPLRQPLKTNLMKRTESTFNTGYCICNKKPSNNLYYDTRFI